MRTDVTICHREIVKVVPEGVVDDFGKLHKVDILVFVVFSSNSTSLEGAKVRHNRSYSF